MDAPDVEALKERTRAAWTLGEYERIAAHITGPAARRLVDACAVSAGQEVLDVAAGTGNVALLAAREGARVVAADLTPRMVEEGRRRTEAEGVEVDWLVADAEELPFAEASFDCVTSAFGVMFAPRPEVAATELFRVLRPGGTVGLAAWRPGSLIARQGELAARYLPAQPPPPPSDWGREEIVEQRLAGLAASAQTSIETIAWEGASVEDYVDVVSGSGPNQALRQAIDGERYAEFLAELRALVVEQVRDGVMIVGDYLLVVARKRG